MDLTPVAERAPTCLVVSVRVHWPEPCFTIARPYSFDEATSNIDVEGEDVIIQQVHQRLNKDGAGNFSPLSKR